jgi:hypothetical protein
MLGRRAAVLIAFASVSAFGGGVALAATHGGSSSSKPQTPATQKPAPRMAPHGEHHCPHMGGASVGPASAGV